MHSTKVSTVVKIMLLAIAVFVLTAGAAFAQPSYVGQIPDGFDKSCSLCHTSPPSLNDFGTKWVAGGKNFAAMTTNSEKAAAPAAKPAATATAKPAASSAAQTVTINYGDKTVKVKAVNKKNHLQVPAGTLTDLFGFGVNDKDSIIPLRQTAEDMGLTVGYNNGQVTLYGTLKTKGQFGKNPALALSGYVGPKTCQGCHSDMVDKWVTTKHATMVQDIKDPNAWVLANFQTNTFFSKDDVSYAVAQGQRYIGMKDGRLQYMPATWNAETNQWVKANPSAYSCGKCHNTGFNDKTGYWFENGITCESCHGPGAEHAATADPSKIRVNTGVDMCQPCHDEGSHNQVTFMLADAAAEQANDAAFKSHLNVLKDSKTSRPSYGDGCTKCHSADVRLANEKGEKPPTWAELKDGPRYGITCVVCHDPHQNTGNPRQLKKTPEGNELCIDCHTNDGPVVSGKAAHHPQKEWFEAQVIDIKDAPAAPNGHECVTCHMPNANHKFEVGKPYYNYDSHGHEVQLDVCGSCHFDMTAAKINSIQSNTKSTLEELEEQLTAFDAKLKAAKAAGADVAQAEKLYNANYTNLHFIESEGSWGIHNHELTEAVFTKAEKDFVSLQSLLAGY